MIYPPPKSYNRSGLWEGSPKAIPVPKHKISYVILRFKTHFRATSLVIVKFPPVRLCSASSKIGVKLKKGNF